MTISYGSDVEISLRGQKVLVDEIQLNAPEFDVGIMGWSIDGWKLFSAETGDELDWDLTEEETAAVDDQLLKALKDWNGPEYEEPLSDFEPFGSDFDETEDL